MSAWAVIAAAGDGTRMGAGRSKTLTGILGEPAICRAVRAFRDSCEGIVLAVRADEQALFEEALGREGLRADRYCPGGKDRRGSVANALRELPADCDIVLIHDGARPLVSAELIRRVIRSAEEFGSGVPALPVTDTVKEVDALGRAVRTVDRARLRTVQTPQAFRRGLLQEAYAREAGRDVTDDAGLLEAQGIPVHLVEGDADNIKLTVPGDLAAAERIAGPACVPRVGTGYDAHRLVPGRPLILGGVRVPFDKGLLGHSDADVAVHALIDALLGACALGDIGTHFPDSDETYRGVSSLELLRKTRDILAAKGFRPCGADITIVAQRPRLSEQVPRMRLNIASALSLSPDLLSVKATTTEGMGFEGRGEGIGAHAVATVLKLR